MEEVCITQQLTEQQQMIHDIERLIESADDFAADLPNYFDPEFSFEDICALHTESNGNRFEISVLIKRYEAKYGPWEETIIFPEDEEDNNTVEEEIEEQEDENATIDLVFEGDDDIPF